MSRYRRIKAVLAVLILAHVWGVGGVGAEEGSGGAVSYVLDKCGRYDVVLLGTRHKRPEVLRFVSGLLRGLKGAYVGLEIGTDQQAALDRYLDEGVGREEIMIHHALDCPEYRNLLDLLKGIRDKNRLKVVALDLPPSLYERTDVNRDQWIAEAISQIFDEDPDARILVMAGNLHTLKAVHWEPHVPPHGFIRSYLHDMNPELKIFSVSQCVRHPPSECDFCRHFGGKGKPVAVDCSGPYANWKLGVLEGVAARPMRAGELVDGVVVY